MKQPAGELMQNYNDYISLVALFIALIQISNNDVDYKQ